MSKINKTQILSPFWQKQWITGILGFAFGLDSIAELWGVNFLMEIHNTTAPNVSGYIIWIWIGIAIGNASFWLSTQTTYVLKKTNCIGFY